MRVTLHDSNGLSRFDPATCTCVDLPHARTFRAQDGPRGDQSLVQKTSLGKGQI